jgi:excisionase family DNA binding protein
MSDAAEVTIGDPAYWAEHADELARLHLASASGSKVVDSPSGQPVDPALKAVLTSPRLWVDYPDELREALSSVNQVPEEGQSLAAPVEDRLVFSVPEAAKLLGVSRSYAYEAIANGDIPAIHIGRRILVPKAALQKLLSGEQGTPAS